MGAKHDRRNRSGSGVYEMITDGLVHHADNIAELLTKDGYEIAPISVWAT